MRLTASVKQQIVHAAIKKSGVLEQAEELRVKRAEWSEAVRVDGLGGADSAKKVDEAEAKIKKVLSGLPKDVVGRGTGINYDCYMLLNCAGLRVIVYFNGCTQRDYQVEHVIKSTVDNHTIHADSPLSIQFHALEEEGRAIDEKRKQIESSVNAALSGVNTDKQLLAVWPEAEELLPEEIKPSKSLPAVLAKDLNTMIGLPSDK